MGNLFKTNGVMYQSTIYAKDVFVECPYCSTELNYNVMASEAGIKCSSCKNVFHVPYYAKIQQKFSKKRQREHKETRDRG